MSAVASALDGLSIFLIYHHTADNQADHAEQNAAYYNCPHTNLLLS